MVYMWLVQNGIMMLIIILGKMKFTKWNSKIIIIKKPRGLDEKACFSFLFFSLFLLRNETVAACWFNEIVN